jgi:hypothetical protein
VTAEGFAEIIGVYHAHSGPVGEARYLIGKLLGSAHCGLCDVTHSGVRRKRSWDAMVARLEIPVRLVHLDEMPLDVATAVRAQGTPCVIGRTHADGLVPLLGPDDVEALGGSVDAFAAALRLSAARTGRPLPG